MMGVRENYARKINESAKVQGNSQRPSGGSGRTHANEKKLVGDEGGRDVTRHQMTQVVGQLRTEGRCQVSVGGGRNV